MTTIDSLVLQTEKNYNKYDIAISGNPQITYFRIITNKNDYKRHTNFSYGMIEPQTTSKTFNTVTWANLNGIGTNSIGDILMGIVLILPDINHLNRITVSIGNFEPIYLTLDWLKVYDKICSQIIFKIESGYIINFNPTHLVYPNESPNSYLFSGLPVLYANIKINWIEVSTLEPDAITLKLRICTLDSVEKAQLLRNTNAMMINPIKMRMEYFEYSKKSKLTNADDYYWDISPNYSIPIGYVCVLISKFDLVESIELVYNNDNFIIPIDIIKTFDIFYEKVIFEHGEQTLIKINIISQFITKPNPYELKINYKNNLRVETNKIYYCYDYLNDTNKTTCLVVLTNEFSNGYFSKIFELDSQADKIIINDLNDKITHIKEIFIRFINKSTGKLEQILNNCTVKFGNITNNYSQMDMEIYSNLHNKRLDNLVYTIGYSLKPLSNYPCGLANISNKSFEFEFDLDSKFNIQNYQIHIQFFGYKVYKT